MLGIPGRLGKIQQCGCLQKTWVGRLEPWAEVCKSLVLAVGGTGVWANIHQKDYGVERSQVSDEEIVTASVFRTRENRFVFKGSDDRLHREISSHWHGMLGRPESPGAGGVAMDTSCRRSVTSICLHFFPTVVINIR